MPRSCPSTFPAKNWAGLELGATPVPVVARSPLCGFAREDLPRRVHGATTVRAFHATPVGIESHPEQLKRKGRPSAPADPVVSNMRVWLPGGRDIFCSAGQY